MFNKIDQKQKDKAVTLRHKGYSLTEIQKETNISRCTLSVMLRNLSLSKSAKEILHRKNFKSQEDSKKEWNQADIWAKDIIGNLSKRDLMLILGMIYWGEGTKSELNMINSDPDILKIFISCLRMLNINECDLRMGLRLFPNCNIKESKKFWMQTLNIPENQVLRIEFVKGSKKHKHKYGMCRIRLKCGSLYFKKIMSIIRHVKNYAAVV